MHNFSFPLINLYMYLDAYYWLTISHALVHWLMYATNNAFGRKANSLAIKSHHFRRRIKMFSQRELILMQAPLTLTYMLAFGKELLPKWNTQKQVRKLRQKERGINPGLTSPSLESPQWLFLSTFSTIWTRFRQKDDNTGHSVALRVYCNTVSRNKAWDTLTLFPCLWSLWTSR